MAKPITSFQGEFRFLSNFWPADVEYDGMRFPTVEHAYQAAKTNDISARIEIKNCVTPGQAKRLGKRVKIRPGWEAGIKLEVMRDLLEQKFSDPSLAAKLKATGDVEIIEGNTWGDTYWGVCRGDGKNHLGKILMQIRESL